MPTVARPGVTDALFDRPSALHGAAHVNRVIAIGERLIRETGLTRWEIPLWAAAYLHDLARRNDGVCEIHGKNAARHRFDELIPLFHAHGLKEEDFQAVKTAVTWHSRRQEIDTQLLKDSDGLDRWRLGSGEQVDPSYLRFPESLGLMTFSRNLCESTEENGITDLETIRKLAEASPTEPRWI